MNSSFMITMIVSWVLCGLVAGFVARLIHPGSDSMGIRHQESSDLYEMTRVA